MTWVPIRNWPFGGAWALLPSPPGLRTLFNVEQIRLAEGRDWLSVADICEYMNVSAFVVTKLLRTGELPAVKFGREWRVARVDFQDYINRQRARAQEKGPILQR